MNTSARTLERQQWRQLGLITVAAVALYAGLRVLPTGTNLSHMDFRVDPKAGNAIEFCDPLNPQFIPVVAARSPVTMTITVGQQAVANAKLAAIVRLHTSTGKPLVPEDLLVTHTRRLHMLIVDPTLQDYQHVHPEPTRTPGEWSFEFLPQRRGVYRFFADFTPAATARGLYASADFAVAGGTAAETGPNDRIETVARRGTAVQRDHFEFALNTAQQPARAGQPIDLRFSIKRPDAAPVPLEPVMGAFAHLVAFDEARTGFAHLHPAEADVTKAPDAKHPALNFKLTIPKPGRYVVWAQVNIAGREMFVPFELNVEGQGG